MIYSFHYPQKQQQMLPLSLHILGINHQQEPILRPDGLSIFQWFYRIKGTGELIINNSKAIPHQGQGALIYPQVPHSYHGLTPEWALHFIGFAGQNCMELLKTLYMHKSGVYLRKKVLDIAKMCGFESTRACLKNHLKPVKFRKIFTFSPVSGRIHSYDRSRHTSYDFRVDLFPIGNTQFF